MPLNQNSTTNADASVDDAVPPHHSTQLAFPDRTIVSDRFMARELNYLEDEIDSMKAELFSLKQRQNVSYYQASLVDSRQTT